jgi:hypothetical protein
MREAVHLFHTERAAIEEPDETFTARRAQVHCEQLLFCHNPSVISPTFV